MKKYTFQAIALALASTVFLIGCGGDDIASNPEPAPVDQQQVTGTKSTNKKQPKKSNAPARSAYDRIDDALDRGNYKGAVDIAVKAGSNKQENLAILKYVQEQLGDPMARGDAKALEAYKKLNAAYIMRHQR